HGTMKYAFEGDSCFIMLPGKTGIICGGSRVDQRSVGELRKYFGVPVLWLKVREECFHLDLAAAALTSREPLLIFCRAMLAPEDADWDPTRAWKRLQTMCRKDGTQL